MKKYWRKVMSFVNRMMEDHVGAYSAQSAYFIIMSFIPFILLFVTLIRYTPLTESVIMTAIINMVPEDFQSFLSGIVKEIYTKSAAIVPFTAIIALWSVGKGFQALMNGLNTIHQVKETRNWFYMRFRAVLLTLAFMVGLIFTLVMLVFGQSLQKAVVKYWPFISDVTAFILQFRTIIALLFLALVFLFIYKTLPNKHVTFRSQLPGALLASISWAVFSFGFSLYFEMFSGFANMYGSLTTIILIMLWLYFCMYILLIGAEINVLLDEK